VRAKAHQALRALRSFASGFKLSYGEASISVDPEVGIADSDDMEADLPELFVRVGEAAKAAVFVLPDSHARGMVAAAGEAFMTMSHRAQSLSSHSSFGLAISPSNHPPCHQPRYLRFTQPQLFAQGLQAVLTQPWRCLVCHGRSREVQRAAHQAHGLA
jgi:hypothetical protein